MTDRLAELSAAGVAVWLDDLSRVRLTTGSLDKMRREQHVVGVTTNPSIFQKALSDADAYDEQLKDLAAQRVTVEAGIRMSWDRILGDAGEPVSIEHYGASAPAKILFEQFGFTADNVVAKANAALARVGEITGHKTGN